MQSGRFFTKELHSSLRMAAVLPLLLANARMLLFIAVPAFLFVALTGPFLYSFVFGSQWHVAGQTAQVYAVAAALFMTVPFERSGLIVNAWWYGPSWHFGRLVTTIGVILACEAISASYLTFILLLTIQSGLLYIVDGGASYLFSKRDAKFSEQATFTMRKNSDWQVTSKT